MNDRIRMMYKAINIYQRRGWKWTNGMYGNQWKTQWVRGKGYFRIVSGQFVELTKNIGE